MTTSTEPRFKSLGEIFEAKLPPEEFAEATEEYHAWADKQAGIYNDGTDIPGETSDKLKLVGTGVVGVGATMTAAGAGPFGAAVAAAGAVVIGAGHVAKMNGNDEMEDPEFEMDQADPLTGETADVDAVGHSDGTPIGRFPFWDVAETATETETVGHPRGLFPLPDFTDQLDNTEDISLKPTDNNWAFVNNTDFIPEPEALSPFEFDVAAPLMTDQAVMGDQSKADPSGFCEDLRWVLPEQDLPFGCK